MTFWPNWVFVSFNTVHYFILALCVMVLILTYVKVWTRYQGKSVFIPTLLSIINTLAVIAMLLLILPIYHVKQVSQQAIVITNNSDEELTQKAIERYRMGDINAFFVLVNEPKQRESLQHYFKQEKMLANIVWLTSSYQLLNSSIDNSPSNRQNLEYNHKFNAIYVYGDGFTKTQLKHLDNTALGPKLYYFPSKSIVGVVDVEWSQEVLLGAETSVSGTLQSDDINNLYLVELVDVNNEVMVKASLRANELFRFKFVPKAAGINQYYLNVRENSSDKILVQEIIQLNVTQGDKLNVLVQTASPSFEVRHLKNWLAEQGSQLTLISQTSKNAHLTQTINTEDKTAMNIDYLSLKNLANVDLLILDGRSVVSLSQVQQQQIIASIKKGLAVFVFIDDALIKPLESNVLINFFQSFTSFKNEASVNINKPTIVYFQHNSDRASNERVLIPSNIRLINESGDDLVINAEKQPLVLSKPFGFGSVTLSAINNSYQWKLSGLNKDYGQYWQYLVGKITHAQNRLSWLTKAHNSILFPLESSEFCYLSPGGDISVEHSLVFKTPVNSNKALNNTRSPTTPLVGNKRIGREHQYCVDWLVTESGWHKLTLLLNEHTTKMDTKSVTSAETLIYVSKANQWLASQQVSKQRATRLKSLILPNENNENAMENSTISTFKKIKAPLNKWPIWIVFISCCSVLWIERKSA